MIDQIARRVIDRIKQEVSAFINESADEPSSEPGSNDLIADVRDHLGALIAEDHQIQKHLKQRDTELSALNHKIELAISSDREDLARAAFIRRNGLRRQIESLKSRQQDIEAESMEIEALIEELSSENGAPTEPDSDQPSPEIKAKLEELETLATKVDPDRDQPKTDGE